MAEKDKIISNPEDRGDDSSLDPSPQRAASSDNDFTHRTRSASHRTKDIPGILRVDSASRSPRYTIAPSFLNPQVVPPSPQPSVDRLSVTFAIAEDPSNGYSQETALRDPKKSQIQFDGEAEMRRVPVAAIVDGDEGGDEDDYSASASAIIQRRASLRKPSRRKRRSSSPFSPDIESGVRRRSSAFTTSSGDTAISIEEGGTQEQIFENLKLHKEVLSGVKQQPWPLRRKIKLVQQAKSYVRRHEGALQERLAQNRSTRDVIARASILVNKNLQYFERELVNLQTWLIPWELRIKEIESHFGSAVASYFIFLRWIFWINLVIAATLAAFVAVPEMLTADATLAGERKTMLPEEKLKSKHLLILWEFEGILKYSPFFYGWYTNQDSRSGYSLPLAYFLANLVVYVYSFVAILRKMAENSRMSKLSEKEDECAFTWKLFTGWDFMIGNPETAHNRIASIVLGFKESLLEEAEKQKVERKSVNIFFSPNFEDYQICERHSSLRSSWQTTFIRTFVNVVVAGLLALSAFAVVQVVSRSMEPEAESNWWRANEITIVMTLISYIFPIFFEILGILENYHPRKQLRFQLARIMVLNLLNLYSLIIALFGKINTMVKELKQLKPNVTEDSAIPGNCRNVPTACPSSVNSMATLASLSLVLLTNITSKNATFGLSPGDTHHVVSRSLADNANFEAIESILRASTSASTTTEEYDWPYDDDYNETLDSDDIYIPGEGIIFYGDDSIAPQTESDNETPYESSTVTNNSGDIDDFNDSTTAYSSTSESSSLSTTSTGSTEEATHGTSTSSSSTETSDHPKTAKDSVSMTTDFGTETTEGSTTTTTTTTTSDVATVKPLANKVIVNCYNQYCDVRRPTSDDRRRRGAALQNVTLDITTRKKLRRLCWETMFGQELAKLTVMDLVLTTISTLGMDFFRAVFVRHMNNFWCWDLEKQFPQYGDFKIAENILHLVNNQGMVWMGMFFSPGLPTLNVIKIGILMYLRSWAVLTCNVPHEIVFRASRSNNFYLALLLTMLFLCVLPVGYAIVWVEPSWHCGPFSEYYRMYRLATESLKDVLPTSFHRILDYIASPGIVIPLIVLMALIIYYMVSLTGSLREANNDLKIQLRQERTEERRKMFRIAEKRHDINEAPFVRWKKILPALPSNKLAGVVIEKGTAANIMLHRKELRKQSAASEAGEATDVEQDSLPHDPAMGISEVAADVVPKKKKLTKQMNSKNRNSNGSTKEGDSQGSQCSDFGVIPKIRICGTEGQQRAASPGGSSVTSVAAVEPKTSRAEYSGSKLETE
ncbi:transmembrane channel-like protein isoform X2 [Athalia rosae]|uniref:transmembrane channel-like protein isoform X2 n=1 Tax=Athalia rosae TaxID=37344 RepID=UPI002033DC29|nr:transmembrane channel-like protein isoform X2 [Athalia rosae]